MAIGRSRTRSLALCLALAAVAPVGCSGPSLFTSRQTSMGTLKASVSQLEFENEKLRKEMGELKADNSRLDNQLVQEREANGEIAARLDDAKDLIRRQGGSAQALGGSSSNAEDDIPPPVSTPKSRRIKTNRPPPAVRIPSPEFEPNNEDVGFAPAARKPPRDIGPDAPDDDRWLPIARGLPSQVRQ
jgi:hypothetical protein